MLMFLAHSQEDIIFDITPPKLSVSFVSTVVPTVGVGKRGAQKVLNRVS